MTRQEFTKLLEKIQKQETDVWFDGQNEYAHDPLNCFANFERAEKDLNVNRMQVLWVFLRKHLDGIVAYMNGHDSQREDVRGRLLDARLYLALLWGMIEDDQRSWPPEPLEPDLSSLNPDVTVRSGSERVVNKELVPMGRYVDPQNPDEPLAEEFGGVPEEWQ